MAVEPAAAILAQLAKSQNAVRAPSGRVVAAVLHAPTPDRPAGYAPHPRCAARDAGNLQGGMGDIFVELCKATHE